MTNTEIKSLLPSVRNGDEQACEQLWQGLKTPIYTVALRILGDSYAAEDVTQEVFVTLFCDPPGEEIRDPRAWIFRVTHNASLNLLRSHRVRETVELDESVSAHGAGEADDADTRLDILAALARIEPLDREIVTLRPVADCGFREIAESIGMPTATVYFRYRRAVARLRELLE